MLSHNQVKYLYYKLYFNFITCSEKKTEITNLIELTTKIVSYLKCN